MRHRLDHPGRAHAGRRPLAALLAIALAHAGTSVAEAAPVHDEAPRADGVPARPDVVGAEAAGPGRPRVHIETRRDEAVSLYEIDPDAEPRRGPPVLRPICDAPCDTVVDGRRGQSFVLGGRGLSRSLAFSLLSADASLTIHVRPGRRALWIAGWVLTSLGAAAVLAGAATLTAADDDRTLRRAGGFTFLGGLPFVAGGIVMVAFGRTRFRLGDRSAGGPTTR